MGGFVAKSTLTGTSFGQVCHCLPRGWVRACVPSTPALEHPSPEHGVLSALAKLNPVMHATFVRAKCCRTFAYPLVLPPNTVVAAPWLVVGGVPTTNQVFVELRDGLGVRYVVTLLPPPPPLTELRLFSGDTCREMEWTDRDIDMLTGMEDVALVHVPVADGEVPSNAQLDHLDTVITKARGEGSAVYACTAGRAVCVPGLPPASRCLRCSRA